LVPNGLGVTSDGSAQVIITAINQVLHDQASGG
jgi:hypothetical protein